MNPDLTTRPGLALEWNPNEDATVYEVKLRDGVTFHNGKTFGAEDVIYSIQQMSKPANFGSLPFVSGIDVGNMKAINEATGADPAQGARRRSGGATSPTTTPGSSRTGQTDFKHPIGTGPFKFASFTPGQQSVFTKNPNYWVTGKPYVDSLKITSISDHTARLNALLSGQIDGMAQLPFQAGQGAPGDRRHQRPRGPVAAGDDVLHGHDRRRRSTTTACARRSG